MFEVRIDIKKSLSQLGKTMADLSRDLRMNYDVLSRYVNGRAKMPDLVQKRIKRTLAGWKKVGAKSKPSNKTKN